MSPKQHIYESQAQDLFRAGLYDHLVDYLGPYIHAVAYQRSGLLDSDDIIQNATLKLLEGIHQYDPSRGTKLTSYVYQVILNQCFDWHNKKNRDRCWLSQVEADYGNPADYLDHYDNLLVLFQIELKRGLAEKIFTNHEIKIVLLILKWIRADSFHFENYDELADRCGVGINAIKKLWFKIEAHLAGRPLHSPSDQLTRQKLCEYRRTHHEQIRAYNQKYRAKKKAKAIK